MGLQSSSLFPEWASFLKGRSIHDSFKENDASCDRPENPGDEAPSGVSALDSPLLLKEGLSPEVTKLNGEPRLRLMVANAFNILVRIALVIIGSSCSNGGC